MSEGESMSCYRLNCVTDSFVSSQSYSRSTVSAKINGEFGVTMLLSGGDRACLIAACRLSGRLLQLLHLLLLMSHLLLRLRGLLSTNHSLHRQTRVWWRRCTEFNKRQKVKPSFTLGSLKARGICQQTVTSLSLPLLNYSLFGFCPPSATYCCVNSPWPFAIPCAFIHEMHYLYDHCHIKVIVYIRP